MKKIRGFLLMFLLTIAAYTSCTHHHMEQQLRTADNLMEKNPDSALRLLDSLKLDYFTKEDSDYYDLLLTQAIVKNNIIVTDDSLIRRARLAFKTSEKLNLHLRSAFYSAKIAFYSGNLVNAMHDAVEAYEIAKKQKDYYWLAKTSELIADIFGESYNYPQAEKFTRMAIELYSKAGYTRNRDYSICNLATYEINQGNYNNAIIRIDSLLSKITIATPSDSALIEYASRTIIPALIYTNQYNRLTTEFSDFLNANDDYDPIGYEILNSYVYNNDDDTVQAQSTLHNALISSAQTTDSIKVLYAKYRLALDNKNFKEAALLSDSLIYMQSIIAAEQISESVTVEYADYYTQKSKEEATKSHQLKQKLYAICLIFFVIIICCIVVLWGREKLYKAKLEVSMSELLRLSQSSSNDKKLIEQLFKDKWSYFNKICSDYFDFGATDYLKTQLLRSAESELKDLQCAIKSDEFFNYVDNSFGGKLSALKKECPNLTKEELNFLALIETKLSMKTISLVLGIKYKTAYQKKYRLQKKLDNCGITM